MKQIKLTQNKFALVDDGDFEILNQCKWQFGGHRYAVRTINHSQKLYMHRFLLNAPKGIEVDHINGNELDNRRCNLRTVTRRQNQLNAKSHLNSLSGLKGVYLRKKDNKWVVYIQTKFIGSFSAKIEAARAYDEAATKYYGEFGRLNNV